MPATRYYRIRIRRQDGIIQHIRVKGRQRSKQHPLRVNKQNQYVNTGPFHAARFPPPRRPPRTPPPPAPATEPPRPPPPATEPPSRRRGAKYHTWFKAAGSMDADMSFKDAYNAGVYEETNEEFAAPTMFFSQEGLLLGQVKFKGIVTLDTMIDDLNDKLQFSGEGSADFDFRTAYPRWSYEYQVVETIGVTSRVIDSARDSRP